LGILDGDRLFIARQVGPVVPARRGGDGVPTDVEIAVAGATEDPDLQHGLPRGDIDLVDLFAAAGPRDAGDRHIVFDNRLFPVGGDQRHAGVGVVASQHDVPRAAGRIVDGNGFVVAGEERSVVIVGIGRDRTELDVEIAVAGPAGDLDLQAGFAGRNLDGEDPRAVLRASQAGDGNAVAQQRARAAAGVAGQQRHAGVGTIGSEHDVPRPCGRVVDSNGFVVAGEERSIVVIGGGGQRAAFDVKIAVAGPAGDADLELGLSARHVDLEVFLTAGGIAQTGHGYAVAQHHHAEAGRVAGLQGQSGERAVASQHDVPRAGRGALHEHRLVVSDLVGPVIIRRGGRLGVLTHIQIAVAGPAGDLDFQFVLPARDDDHVELLAAGRPGNAGDRNAIAQAGRSAVGHRSHEAQGHQAHQASHTRLTQTVHFELLSLSIPMPKPPISVRSQMLDGSSTNALVPISTDFVTVFPVFPAFADFFTRAGEPDRSPDTRIKAFPKMAYGPPPADRMAKLPRNRGTPSSLP